MSIRVMAKKEKEGIGKCELKNWEILVRFPGIVK